MTAITAMTGTRRSPKSTIVTYSRATLVQPESPPRASSSCEEEVRSQRGGNELDNEHIYPDMRDAESSTREQ
ncbi:unnamed protein product [Penicillium palitans]